MTLRHFTRIAPLTIAEALFSHPTLPQAISALPMSVGAAYQQRAVKIPDNMSHFAPSIHASTTTTASDWVDYALDHQTVVGPGCDAKITSAYDHTWSSSTSNQTTWHQINDPNTNPNGVLPGNGTQDTKVRGNGQSY
ncbi:MAG: hypothetical protein WBY53_12750 [Acidobacteriaceae bacterium]